MRRKLLIGIAALLGLLLVAGVVLWILKPWVPKIVFADPSPDGIRVHATGVYANFYPASASGHWPAVMLLGGSEGGIGDGTNRIARALRAEGFTVMAPSYFGAPGQASQLERIPLETFDRALAWLKARPEVDPGRIAVGGVSKGAEAALLVATRHPELRAVFAGAPSGAVWPGINWNGFFAGSSWTVRGKPLPFVPYGRFRLSVLFGDIGRLYSDGLKNLTTHRGARIPVERINAPVLLVCGERDTLWPSCAMSRQIKQRVPSVALLAYPKAGHLALGPPLDKNDPSYGGLARWGGTAAGNNAARADGWPKILEFLRTRLVLPVATHTETPT